MPISKISNYYREKIKLIREFEELRTLKQLKGLKKEIMQEF